MKRHFLLYLLFLFSIFCFGQKLDYNPYKHYPKEVLLNDFDLMTQSVLDFHPDVNAFVTKDSLLKLAILLKAQITDSMTDNQFSEITRKWLVSVNCGHTTSLPSLEWYSYFEKNPFLPSFEVIVLNEKLFIKRDFF